MALPAEPPPLKSPAYTSSDAPGTGSPGANPISKVAHARMNGTSSSGTALVGGASTDYDFKKNLEAAESELLEGKNDTALKMFSEIKSHIEKTKLPVTSFFPPRCFLGLALSSSSPQDKTRYYESAYGALEKLYLWGNQSADVPSSAYSELRWHLKNLKPLIPKAAPLIRAKVDDMITGCTKHILPIDNFYEKLKEADVALKTNKITTAREWYENALKLIAKESQIEFEVARSTCLLKLTGTYKKDESGRADMRNRAQKAIFLLFDNRASLYEKGKRSKADAFRLLIASLRALRTVTAVDPVNNMENLRAIQEKIEVCRPEIPEELSQSTAHASDSDRKVTPGSPDGSWNLGRLFIAAVCIALAVATVALYRRYSVKLN